MKRDYWSIKTEMKQDNIFKQIFMLILPMALYLGIQFFCVNFGYFLVVFFSALFGKVDLAGDGVQVSTKLLLILNMIASISAIPIFTMMYQREENHESFWKNDYPVKLLGKFIWIIPFGLFAMLSANFVVSFLSLFMPDFMIESYSDTKEIIDNAPGSLQVIASVILAPIVEELIFRGLIYTRLKQMTSLKAAAVISAALFGAFHMNWLQAPYAFLIGIMCVFVYEKYQTIFATIFFHGMANMFSVLSMFMLGGGGESTEQPSTGQLVIAYIFWIWITGAFVVLIGMIINHRVKIKEIKKNEVIDDYDSML
ncbi:MAG: CPBP family intramembrane metalloprotease [Eubacterium sp.]|nr:CPBP family intramembrane metalloprotease [Eubacterium sp.]